LGCIQRNYLGLIVDRVLLQISRHAHVLRRSVLVQEHAAAKQTEMNE
jgi:hypothetical protein